MIVKNPTESKIEVTILGVDYSVDAKGEVSVPNQVAAYWKNRLHSFLEISEEVKEVEKVVKVEKVEKVEKEVKKVKDAKAK